MQNIAEHNIVLFQNILSLNKCQRLHISCMLYLSFHKSEHFVDTKLHQELVDYSISGKL